MQQLLYLILNEKLKTLENWRAQNTVFMLGLVLGTKVESSFLGPAVHDASGIEHAGIGTVVLPVLAMKEMEMITFYKRCKDNEKTGDITVIDFTLTAQNSHVYDEYWAKLALEKIENQVILGIGLLGEQKALKSLCGSLARWK